MELVINISDSVYNTAKRYAKDKHCIKIYEVDDILNAIANGTPLPKGHGNLIQREEAETIFRIAKMALYRQSRTEQIKDFQTRESMLLNAEQFVHSIKPIIGADRAESEEEPNQIAYNVGGHTYGVIGGDEIMREFEGVK